MEDLIYCPMCAEELTVGEIEGNTRQYCPQCTWVYFRNPVPVVASVVFDNLGRLLLIKRGIEPHKGEWALPGGFMELFESVEDAAARELYEETGIRGNAPVIIGVTSENSKLYGSILAIGIKFSIFDNNLTAGDDAIDARFFPLKDLPEIPIKSHKFFIENLF